jgi:hypothetical protein
MLALTTASMLANDVRQKRVGSWISAFSEGLWAVRSSTVGAKVARVLSKTRFVDADHRPGAPPSSETQGWTEGAGSLRPPALTELLGREIGNRVLLVKNEYWIGSDSSCSVCR